MKVLILGGTLFLGRELVQQGPQHEWTIFHRGKHGEDLFPEQTRVLGDRLTDLDRLPQGDWDACIDTSAYFPRAVRIAADALAGRVSHYTLISTCSVYAEGLGAKVVEGAPVATLEDPAVEEITGGTYGGLKALCEQEAQKHFEKTFVPRPGLIVGPNDPSGRFTYWPVRFKRGGDVLCPGSPDAEIQFIDVRDLAVWILKMVEGGATGTFNATGPAPGTTTMGALVDACVRQNPSAKPLWVDEKFLLEHEVQPWSELPLWIPAEMGPFSHSTTKSVEAGLVTRPVEETVADTLAWAQEQNPPAGPVLTVEKESELLREWSSIAPVG